MIIYKYFLPISFLLFTLLNSCNLSYKRGDGHIVKEELEIEPFKRISIGGNYEVTLIESDQPMVIIETDENLLGYINTELHNETLSINNVHNLKSTEGIKVEIYYNNIEKVYSTGASKISNQGVINTDDLLINLSGAGAIEFDLDTENVEVNLTGAGVVTLKGKTNSQEVHISGAGGLRAKNLISNSCNINLSGLGGAEVYAEEKLEATITGIGGIIYAGNPKIIERQVTGFGKIKRAEEYIYDEDV